MIDSIKTSTDIPEITIVIPNWNGMRWLPNCLSGIENQTFRDFQVIIVDNGSSDGSVDWIQHHYPLISIMRFDENRGFAAAVNAGIGQAVSPFIALLNTDTEVDARWLEFLLKTLLESPRQIGAVTPLMISMQDRSVIDDAGDQLSWYGVATKIDHGKGWHDVEMIKEVFSPCAGAALYRRQFLLDVGMFDEDFFAYLEDVDLGLRGRILGYRYLINTKALVYHQSHGSNINYPFYISLVTRNRMFLFLKNIPFRLIIKFLPNIIYGQIYFLVAFGHFFASMKGYAGFLLKWPRALGKRRKIIKRRVLSLEEISQLLSKEKPGEGILFHLKKLWS